MFIEEITEEKLKGITLLYGGAGSGKTTLCLEELRGRTIYIATGRNFSPERLHTMRSDAKAMLERLVIFEVEDLAALEKAVTQAVKLSAMSDLIVIDSLATHLRASERKLANLALHRILNELHHSACPVILTSEVYDRAEGNFGVQFIGGDMLRLVADTIIELHENVATVKKHSLHTGREWKYQITNSGIEKEK